MVEAYNETGDIKSSGLQLIIKRASLIIREISKKERCNENKNIFISIFSKPGSTLTNAL
jgi:hypothetical protein